MGETNDFCRVAALTPTVRPGMVAENVASMLSLAHDAVEADVAVAVFPELSVTGYTCADLFFQPALLDAADLALETFLKKTMAYDTLFFVGLPVRAAGSLFNCAVACCRGEVLGVIPKYAIPTTHEFYEARWFTSGADAPETVVVAGQYVPMGVGMTFMDASGRCCVGVEICEDLWSPMPPSIAAAVQGATVLCNLSASNELVGKHDYRRALVSQQSARCLAAYVYAGAGVGESTTDLVFAGQALLAENGQILAESERFTRTATMTIADVDVAYLAFERLQNKVFTQAQTVCDAGPRVAWHANALRTPERLMRPLEAQPFVPADPAVRDARCEEIFAIQSAGLATRLAHTNCKRVVLGLSGGLDSALALLVTVEAFTRLGLPLEGIGVFTMPGFGTSERTYNNCRALCAGLGLVLESIDITAACTQHFADIGHDAADHSVTYENTQARERTQILMDKANQCGGMVIGTGDLSELALGWCTYNGDHMSMYGVNAGVPKTLVRYLVAWVAEKRVSVAAAEALRDILATPVSPELLPPAADGAIAQKTEDVVGPYILHDFFLFHFVRRGAQRAKIAMLARAVFTGQYDAATIDHWLDIFFKRFFTQQFKRSCMPDGPKVGSVNLSPRGDWRMPSDASGSVF